MGPPQICILHRGAISSRKGNPNKLLQMCSGIVSSNKSVVLILEASCIHDIMIPVHWRGWDGKQCYLCTVTAEIISTPEIFPEKAPFLPEYCYSYKCFGLHFISFICIWSKNPKRTKVTFEAFHTELGLDKIIGIFSILLVNCLMSSVWRLFEITCGRKQVLAMKQSHLKPVVAWVCCTEDRKESRELSEDLRTKYDFFFKLLLTLGSGTFHHLV